MPYGYGVDEATIGYADGQWTIEFTILTPKGKHRAAQIIYPEQVLVVDTYAFGRDVMEHVINDLTKEDPVSWQTL